MADNQTTATLCQALAKIEEAWHLLSGAEDLLGKFPAGVGGIAHLASSVAAENAQQAAVALRMYLNA